MWHPLRDFGADFRAVTMMAMTSSMPWLEVVAWNHYIGMIVRRIAIRRTMESNADSRFNNWKLRRFITELVEEQRQSGAR